MTLRWLTDKTNCDFAALWFQPLETARLLQTAAAQLTAQSRTSTEPIRSPQQRRNYHHTSNDLVRISSAPSRLTKHRSRFVASSLRAVPRFHSANLRSSADSVIKINGSTEFLIAGVAQAKWSTSDDPNHDRPLTPSIGFGGRRGRQAQPDLDAQEQMDGRNGGETCGRCGARSETCAQRQRGNGEYCDVGSIRRFCCRTMRDAAVNSRCWRI